jgi:hypothetical protein
MIPDKLRHAFGARVKMVSQNEQGREFVPGMFTKGRSFGEPPFFDGAPYMNRRTCTRRFRRFSL